MFRKGERRETRSDSINKRVSYFLPWSQVELVVKNPPASVGEIRDWGSVLELGRSPGGEHGNPLHYSCLKNSMDKGALQTIVRGIGKNQT